MPLVDTHQHLWDLQQFPYSWCAGIPALNRSFLPDDYRAAAAGTGITKAVFVECDVDEPHLLAEARHVQQLAETWPLIAGIVAGVRPGQDGFVGHLQQLAHLPKVRGVRRVLHTQPDELSQSSRFIDDIRRLPDFGFSFDLCVLARQLPVAIALVQACPQVTFILDHCGVPDVKSGNLDPWRSHIRALADLPNVSCKLSGLVAYANASWTMVDLQPWVAHVLASFGPDRVVWGGDWPVCTLGASLSRWVEATRQLTAHLTPDDQARLFHRNAERLYRLP
jgi:predicted TIM-barrel fold metal-dependent hydrolase